MTRTWTSAEREIAANNVANINESARANRYSALLDRYSRKVERSCDGPRRVYESAAIALMTKFAESRASALATATAALAAK